MSARPPRNDTRNLPPGSLSVMTPTLPALAPRPSLPRSPSDLPSTPLPLLESSLNSTRIPIVKGLESHADSPALPCSRTPNGGVEGECEVDGRVPTVVGVGTQEDTAGDGNDEDGVYRSLLAFPALSSTLPAPLLLTSLAAVAAVALLHPACSTAHPPPCSYAHHPLSCSCGGTSQVACFFTLRFWSWVTPPLPVAAAGPCDPAAAALMAPGCERVDVGVGGWVGVGVGVGV